MSGDLPMRNVLASTKGMATQTSLTVLDYVAAVAVLVGLLVFLWILFRNDK